MNREAVQHERGPRNSTIRKQIQDFTSAASHEISTKLSLMNGVRSPMPNLYPFPTSFHYQQAPNITIPKERVIKAEHFSSPPLVRPPIIHSLPPTPPPVDLSTKQLHPKICEKAARILYLNSRLVKCIPAFNLLSSREQEILYQNVWLKLLTLGCAQYLSSDDLEYIKNDGNVSALEMASFQSTVNMLRTLHLSEQQFGYVRNVILFRQPKHVMEMLDSGRELVQQIGDHSYVALAQEMIQKTDGNSLKLAKLMMTISSLESPDSKFFHQLFFKDTIGDVSLDLIVLDVFNKSNNENKK